MTLFKNSVENNVAALAEGALLLSHLNSEQYQAGFKPAFQSTIGAHFRHLLEHYLCFFSQLDSGQLCYDKRQRDPCLEQDIDYALACIEGLIAQFGNLKETDVSPSISLDDEHLNESLESNVYRELLFLQSHTVHHYAIIAAISRALGFEPEQGFGVAIQTRNFIRRSHDPKLSNQTNVANSE